MPVVAGPLAFWHMPKCGGTFVQRYLLTDFCGVRVGKGHDPAWYADRLGIAAPRWFGVIRDPWTWYPSLYRHAGAMLDDRGGGWTKAHVAAGGGDGFKSWLRSVLDRVFDPPIGIWPTDPEYPPPDGSEGLWSWLARYIYQDRDRARWMVRDLVDVSRVYEGLRELTGRVVDPVKHPVHNAANSRERRQETPSVTDYRGWYDDESLGWVAAADRDLIARLGYQPFGVPPSPIHHL